MRSCSTCRNRDWLCERCRMEELEDRLGTAADRDVSLWILEADLWHASTAFDGQTHNCACGTEIKTPLERSAEDLRYVPDEFDAPVCEDCVDELEEPRQETIPADANFERASKLVTDGGVDVDAVREGLDYWIRSTYCTNGRAIHIPSEDSTRDDPETPCSHSARSGGWRTVDIDHYPDDHLADRLCTDCVAIATGTGPDRSDVDYSRTPMDVLREAGLEPDDDREIVTDGGTDKIVPAGAPIDPFVCPRRHHSISLSRNRFSCDTCRNQGRKQTSWCKSELIDLRERGGRA